MVDFAYVNLLRSLDETICERDKRHAGLHTFGRSLRDVPKDNQYS